MGDPRRHQRVRSTEMAKKKPENPGLLYDCRRFAEVVSLFPKLDESIPAEYVLDLTRSLEALGKRSSALDFLLEIGLQKVRQEDPSMFVEALCDTGRLHHELKKLEGAKQYYSLAAKLDPLDWEPSFRLGMIANEEGVFPRAFKNLRRSSSLDTHLLSSLVQSVCWRVSENGMSAVCRDYIEARIRQDYVDSVLVEHYFKRHLHSSQDYNPDTQITTLLRWLTRRASGDSNILAFVGHVWCELGLQGRGVRVLKRVLREEPSHPFANLSLALFLNKMGKTPRVVYRYLCTSLANVDWKYRDFEAEVCIGTYYYRRPLRYALDAQQLWMNLSGTGKQYIVEGGRLNRTAAWRGFLSLRREVLAKGEMVLRRS